MFVYSVIHTQLHKCLVALVHYVDIFDKFMFIVIFDMWLMYETIEVSIFPMILTFNVSTLFSLSNILNYIKMETYLRFRRGYVTHNDEKYNWGN